MVSARKEHNMKRDRRFGNLRPIMGWMTAAMMACGAAIGAEGKPGASSTTASLKAPWVGLIDSKGLPVEGWEKIIDHVDYPIGWNEIEPAEGKYDFKKIDDFLALANSKGIKVFLRLYCGRQAPKWLCEKAGTVVMNDRHDGIKKACVQWWKPEAGKAYYELQKALAARYDNDPRFLAITMSRCTSIWAEPFQRQISDKESVKGLRDAGYTAELDKAAHIETLKAHAECWKHTRSSVAINPYQSITGDKAGLDMDFTLAFIDEAVRILGDRLLLQNNSLRSPLSKLGPLYGKMYEKMKEVSKKGTVIGFQSAAMKRVGDMAETVKTAIALNASYFEVPSGYAKVLNKEDAALFDKQLEDNNK